MAFLVGAIAGYTGAPNGVNPAALERARNQVADANSRVADLEYQLSTAFDDLSDARGEAAVAQAEVADLKAKLDEARSAPASKPKPASETQPKAQPPAGSIPDDGIWQAGPSGDFPPGTYRAPGGGICYWARLRGPGGGGINNIIENGLGKNPTVGIEPHDWFETSGCGEWTQIG